MIHLDTSILIDALTGPRRSGAALRAVIEQGDRLSCSTIVLYEWLRGPRHQQELRVQEALFPRDTCAEFGPAEAARAAALYRSVRRPRGREIDLAIAASAIEHQARFWTLNADDFVDIPGLHLYAPAS